MTNHAVADELFTGEFKAIRAAYREGEGNATIRAACQREVGALFISFSFKFVFVAVAVEVVLDSG